MPTALPGIFFLTRAAAALNGSHVLAGEPAALCADYTADDFPALALLLQVPPPFGQRIVSAAGCSGFDCRCDHARDLGRNVRERVHSHGDPIS
jgi:hypothetical protein